MNFSFYARSWNFRRLVAFFLLPSFITGTSPAYSSRNQPEPSLKKMPVDLSSIHILEKTGKIEELFRGGEKTVILIRDAHAIADAQRNIQKIIHLFQREYGVKFVGVEGASTELDMNLFKSFPDKAYLKKVFDQRRRRGEMTGVASAAVLNKVEATYRGMEDWELYEKGFSFYLQAAEREGKILKNLESEKRRINSEKIKTYSGELLEVDQVIEKFQSDTQNFIETLKVLARYRKPEKSSELGLVAAEAENPEISTELEIEIKDFAGQVASALRGSAERGRADLKAVEEFNKKLQEFQTSQRSAVEFAVYLKAKVDSSALELRMTKKLESLIQNHKRMCDIEGSRLFEDFEAYADSVKSQLITREEEKRLDRESRRLYLLEKLSKLELSHKDWDEIKTNFSLSQGEGGLRDDLKFHFDFYKNAEKREDAILRNLQKQNAGTSILVAGGFHSEGLTQKLKEQGISYVLIAPGIKEIPDKTAYLSQMQGRVSWKKYYKVENGKVDLHEAYVRGLRDELLGKVPLKQWRDQILRDLAAEGEIQKARNYTKFLDEMVPEALNDPAILKWQENIQRFLDGMRHYDSAGKLTEPNVRKLLSASQITDVSAAGPFRDSLFGAFVTWDGARFVGVQVPPDIMKKSELRIAGKKTEDGAVKQMARRTDEKDDEASKKSEKPEIAPAQEFLLLEADYNFLSPVHEVTIWVNNRLRRLFPDTSPEALPGVHVLGTNGYGINAMAFNNWEIVLSPELIQFLKYDEELDFVLLHEMNHLLQGHHEDPRAKTILESFGMVRLHEYEADMRAFFQMAESKRQSVPRGAIVFLQRFRDWEEENTKSYDVRWDPAHGELDDRILNMKTVVRIWPMQKFEEPLHEVEAKYKESLPPPKKNGGKLTPFLKSSPQRNTEWDNRERELAEILAQAVQESNLFLLQAALSAVYERLVQARLRKDAQVGEKRGLSVTDLQYEWYFKIFGQLYYSWQKVFDKHYAKFDVKTRLNYQILLLGAGVGLPFLDKDEPAIKAFGITARIRTFKDGILSQEDLNQLWKSWVSFLENNQDPFASRSGIIYSDRLYSLITELMQTAISENAVFDADDGFNARGYLETSSNLLEKAGALAQEKKYPVASSDGGVSLNDAWTEIVLKGIYSAVDNKQWDKARKGYGLVLKRLEGSFELQITSTVSVLDKIAAAFESREERDASPQFTVLQKFFKKQFKIPGASVDILDELDESIKEIKKNNFDYHNLKTKELLERAAYLINALPEKIHIDDSWEGEFITEHLNLKRGEVLRYFFLNLSSWLNSEDTTDFVNILTLVRWAQLTAWNDEVYRELLLDLTEGDFFRINNRRATLKFISDLKDAAMRPESVFETENRVNKTAFEAKNTIEWNLMALDVLGNTLSEVGESDVFFKILEEHLKLWRIPTPNPMGDDMEWFVHFIYPSIFKKGFGLLDASAMAEPDDETRRRILLLTPFMFDLTKRKILEDFLVDQIVRQADFAQAVKFITGWAEERGSLPGPQVLKILEEKAESPGELDELKKQTMGVFSRLQNSLAGAGTAVSVDGFFSYFIKRHSRMKVLSVLMESEYDETRVREFVNEFWTVYNDEGIDRAYYPKDLNVSANIKSLEAWAARKDIDREMNYWLLTYNGDLIGRDDSSGVSYLSVPEISQMLYRLGTVEKLILLRKLLGGQKGVLANDQSRVSMLHEFMRIYIQDDSQGEVLVFLAEVLQRFFQEAEKDDLQVMLESLLLGRIANPPSQPLPYVPARAFERKVRNRWLMKVRREGNLDGDLFRGIQANKTLEQISSLFKPEDETDFLALKRQYEEQDEEQDEELYEEQYEEQDEEQDWEESNSDGPRDLSDLLVQRALEKKMTYHVSGVAEDERGDKKDEDRLFEAVLPPSKRMPESKKKLSPMGGLVEVAKNLLTPGVRFVQLLRFAFKIPKEYDKDILGIFDEVVGQSKSAFWEAIEQIDPAFAKKIKRIGRRLGGGALYTVYEVDVNTGKFDGAGEEIIETEAVRVMNPQAYDQSMAIISMMRKALKRLAVEVPEKGYDKALPLLELLEEWITNELNDPTYEADDARFLNFEKMTGPDGVSILKIPHSKPTGTSKMRREEYVPAKNLTKFLEIPFEDLAPDDQKRVRKFIAQAWNFYLLQLATGQALSDISPGNMGIGEGDKMVFYDRGMYLKFDEADGAFVGNLFTVETLEEKIRLLVNFVYAKPENKKNANLPLKEKVVSEILNNLSLTGNVSMEAMMQEITQGLWSQGVKIPLKYQLLIRNVNVFARLAEYAGYQSLQEITPQFPGFSKSELRDAYERQKNLKRSEMRALAQALRPAASGFERVSVGSVIAGYRLNPDKFSQELKAQPEEIRRAAWADTRSGFASSLGSGKTKMSLGLLAPSGFKPDSQEYLAFLSGYFAGMDPAAIHEVLLNIKMTEPLKEQLEIPRELTLRQGLNLAQPVELKGEGETVTVAVLNEKNKTGKAAPMYLPFFIGSSEDWLWAAAKLSYSERLEFLTTLGSLVRSAQIQMTDLAADLRFKNDAKALNEELLKRLNLLGYDSFISTELEGNSIKFQMSIFKALEVLPQIAQRFAASA